MAVYLPSTPLAQAAKPFYVDFGGVLTPPLGGIAQRVNRIGNRWGLSVQMPPMRPEPHGRVWVAALVQAKTDAAVWGFPQIDLAIGTPGAPKVETGGMTGAVLTMRDFTPFYEIRHGQFFSLAIDGRHYLYQARATVSADGAGRISLPIQPMIRKPAPANTPCNFTTPLIEGFLGDGALPWDLDTARVVGLEFTITEAA